MKTLIQTITNLLSMKKNSQTKDTAEVKKLKDANSWKKLAKKQKVSTPFFSKDGAIFKTSDGKWYPNLDQFHADGGAPDGSNCTKL